MAWGFIAICIMAERRLPPLQIMLDARKIDDRAISVYEQIPGSLREPRVRYQSLSSTHVHVPQPVPPQLYASGRSMFKFV
jgi:hypothetical protein